MEFEKSLVHLATQIKNWSDEKFAKLEQEQLQLKLALASVETKEGPKGDQGPQGEKGLEGAQGRDGIDGKDSSAEDVASLLKSNEEFLKAIKGVKGEDGKSVTVDEAVGYLISDTNFVKSLIGPKGDQGEKGEKGQDGQSVDTNELISKLLSDDSFLKSITGPQGPQGEQGLRGEDGASVSTEEVVKILKQDADFLESIIGLDGQDGSSGQDGLGIKAFEISDAGDLAVEMTDGQVVELGNIMGPQGKSVSVDEVVGVLQSSEEFLKAVRGPKGDSFPEDRAVEIIKELIEDTNKQYELEFSKSISGIEEKKQELDMAVAAAQTKAISFDMAVEQNNRNKVQQYVPEVLVKAGSWVEHNGRFYVANRDTDSTPGDSSAYSLVLRGFEFKKAWNSDTNYERLDVVISSTGSAWVANKSQPQGEPGTTPDWNLLVKRGERGAKGDMGSVGPQGDRGQDGVGYVGSQYDMAAEELQLVKSDGTIDKVAMPLVELTESLVQKYLGLELEKVELPITDFKGAWNSKKTYTRGDVVSFDGGLYIAKKKTKKNVAPLELIATDRMQDSIEMWQLFVLFGASGGGGSGGGIPFPADTTLAQVYSWNPRLGIMEWAPGGSSNSLIVVRGQLEMDAIPPRQLFQGVMVYLRDSNQLFQLNKFPRTGSVADWTLIGGSKGVPAYARLNNLLVSTAGSAKEGDVAIVLKALDGTPEPRLMTYYGAPTNAWLETNFTSKVYNTKLLETADVRRSAPGDIRWVVTQGHEEIRVADNAGILRTVYSWDTIAAAIAAGNQFQGTVQEKGHGTPGSVDLDALKPQTALGATDKAHYWIYTGTPGHILGATELGGAASAITGAVLNVGDWIIVSETTDGAGLKTYQYNVVPGDLLAKSRGDNLYGMNTWIDGGYEKGALVVYQGNMYKATAPVILNDLAPDAIGSKWVKVPLASGVLTVTLDTDRPATPTNGTLVLVLSSLSAGGGPALYVYDQATTSWLPLSGGAGGTGVGLLLNGGREVYNEGTPIGTIIQFASNDLNKVPPGYLLCDGRGFDRTLYSKLFGLLGVSTTPNLANVFLRNVTGSTEAGKQLDFAQRHTLSVATAPGTADQVYVLFLIKAMDNGMRLV